MKNKVSCELCDAPANMYCDSDRANLCWQCDNKVHGANFLVAKHNRCVLCHNCQAMTPWTAFGPMLPPSVSFCLSCVSSHNNNHCTTQLSVQSSVNDDNYHNDDDEDDVESSLYEDEGEEGHYCSNDVKNVENDVVPTLTLSNCVMSSSCMEMSGCSSDQVEEDASNNTLL